MIHNCNLLPCDSWILYRGYRFEPTIFIVIFSPQRVTFFIKNSSNLRCPSYRGLEDNSKFPFSPVDNQYCCVTITQPSDNFNDFSDSVPSWFITSCTSRWSLECVLYVEVLSPSYVIHGNPFSLWELLDATTSFFLRVMLILSRKNNTGFMYSMLLNKKHILNLSYLISRPKVSLLD
jgi:hypothetical protein